MAEYLLGKRLAQRHEENGPVDGVEADDVLADQVEIRRPEIFILLVVVPVRIVATEGDVVGQRIEPHIHHMLGIKFYRDAPCEGGAGYAQVLKAGLQEIVDHLVLPGFRLNEFRVLLNIVEQPIGIFAHTEEICLFFCILNLMAAVRAFAILELTFSPETFTGSAVLALIGSLVDVALIIEPLEDLLHLFHVLRIRSADELVVSGVHQIPDAADFSGYTIHILLRGDAGSFSLFLNLLAMLIRSGLEVYLITGHALIPGDGIGKHDLVSVADVGL